MQIFPRLCLLYAKTVSFILHRSTAAFSHRKPTSTATSRNTGGYRVSDEKIHSVISDLNLRGTGIEHAQTPETFFTSPSHVSTDVVVTLSTCIPITVVGIMCSDQ